MKLDTSRIRDGNYKIGEIVWVCDYRCNVSEIDNKPLRNVKPTKVMIQNADVVDKRVYYSDTVLSKVSEKTGQPLKSFITLVDNTGFRSHSGNEVHVFDNEQECVEYWNKLISNVVDLADIKIANTENYWKNFKQKMIDMKIG